MLIDFLQLQVFLTLVNQCVLFLGRTWTFSRDARGRRVNPPSQTWNWQSRIFRMSFQLHCSNQIQICKPFVYFICLCTLLFCVFNGQEVVDINGVHFFVISFISGILWLFCKYHNSNRQRIKNANDKVSWNRNWSQANKHFLFFI